MKVALSYGFTEGPWHARKFVRSLKQHGFGVTTKLETADVIVAHSGGCYTLPKNGAARIVLMIGMPYHPDKHPRKGLAEKIALEIKNIDWYKKTVLSCFYCILHPIKWWQMWNAWQNARVPSTGNYPTIISVRNEHDPFMHPIESEVLASKHGWHTKILPGQHDDLWENPEPYVQILRGLS